MATGLTVAASAVANAITHISLHATNPGTTGAGEVAGSGYARLPVTLPAAVDGQAVRLGEEAADDDLVLCSDRCSDLFHWQKLYLWNAHINTKSKHISNSGRCIACTDVTNLC